MEETEGRKGTEAWGRRCAPDFNKTSQVSPQLPPQESWKGQECESVQTQTRSDGGREGEMGGKREDKGVMHRYELHFMTQMQPNTHEDK